MNNDITFNDFNQSTSILSPNSPETPNHEQYYMRLDTTNIKNNNSKSGSTYVSSAKQTRNQLRNQFNAFDIGDTLQTKDPDIIENSKSTMHPLDILLAHKKMPQQSSNKIYTTNKADTNIHNRNDSIYSDMDDSNYEDEPIVGDGGNSCSSRGSISSKASHGAPRTLTKDDKRKRNTAASARFRKKKKMKEQELQSTATEMTDKAQRMQEKVHELETEIKWLKALVVEKNEARLEQLVRNKPSHSIAFPTANTLTRQESDKISSFKK
ncbi:hypothetical protein BDB01DRAFT_193957 [Pilobolus umbonatus]|nr:hypothetical protein BDB01DRAFT_193957 [Pilobolus umbonatus]